MKRPTQEYYIYARDEHIKMLESQLHQCREREARYREALEKAYEILKIHGKYETALWCKMARATQEEVQDALSSPSQPSRYQLMEAVVDAARKLVYYRSINKELDDALAAYDKAGEGEK
jgi:flagellar biosynthesis/type III secretory pathway protein FliH